MTQHTYILRTIYYGIMILYLHTVRYNEKVTHTMPTLGGQDITILCYYTHTLSCTLSRFDTPCLPDGQDIMIL